MQKLLKTAIIIFSVSLFYFAFKDQTLLLIQYYFPCKTPIAYSIGTFDQKFGIGQEEFLAEIKRAENAWESAVGRELFALKKDGRLKINLIYDDRQQATETLNALGERIDVSKDSYDELRSAYDSLKRELSADEISYASQKASFEKDLREYNTEVSALNKKGGAREDQYAELQNRRALLEAKQAELNALALSINEKISRLNTLAGSLNKIAGSINREVSYYNTVGENYREFEGGTYRQSGQMTAIDIFQFDDKQALFQVLMHELGHALGLEHVKEPSAIMYYLNDGVKLSLAKEDITELKRVCKMK